MNILSRSYVIQSVINSLAPKGPGISNNNYYNTRLGKLQQLIKYCIAATCDFSTFQENVNLMISFKMNNQLTFSSEKIYSFYPKSHGESSSSICLRVGSNINLFRGLLMRLEKIWPMAGLSLRIFRISRQREVTCLQINLGWIRFWFGSSFCLPKTDIFAMAHQDLDTNMERHPVSKL